MDGSAYERARRGVNSEYGANTAANEYSRFIAQQRGARRVGDLSRNFKSGWGDNVSGWGRKGHTGPSTKSGFYQQAMTDYSSDYQRQNARLLQDLKAEQDQFGLQQTRYQAARDRALADLEMQRKAQIASLAKNIRAVKPGIG